MTRLQDQGMRPAALPASAVALGLTVVGLVGMVIAPFIAPLAWAVILGHAAWPLHRRTIGLVGDRRTLASLLTTGLVTLALVVPLLWMVVLLQDDLRRVYDRGQELLAGSTDSLFDQLAQVPWFGPSLHDWLTSHAPPASSVGALLGSWARQGSGLLLAALGNVGRNALKFALAIVFLFFIFRDGDVMLARARSVLAAMAGRRVDAYFDAAGDTNRAITLSVVLAAVLQGVMAALGYAVVGLSAPILLGFLTALASVLPMLGTSLVWGALAAWLFASGHPWQGIVLATWGLILIHPVDNILRPWIVSNAAKMPFLVAFLGVLGGLATFGFVGVVLGPIILAVGSKLWNASVVGDAGDDA